MIYVLPQERSIITSSLDLQHKPCVQFYFFLLQFLWWHNCSFRKSVHCFEFQAKYRVIHKSLRDFRPLRYGSRDGHVQGEHVNRRRDTPSFCPILQVFDMSTVGDAADVNRVIKFLPHMCIARVWQELDYRIDICRITKGGHIEHL